MKDRQSIIGFTEAELGLVLALIFLALWVDAQAKIRPQVPGVVEVSQRDLGVLRDSVQQGSKAIVTLAVTRDSLRRLRDSLSGISNQTPRCIERGYSERFLGEILIRGRNDYEIGGRRTDLSGVLAHFAEPLAWAKAHRCLHAVRVSGVPELAVKDYTPALRAIRQRFNTDIR
jgi:hypothetical protein